MRAMRFHFLLVLACAIVGGCTAPIPAHVNHAWDVDYQLSSKEEYYAATPNMVRAAHRLIESSRTLQKGGPGTLGGTNQELARLDHYVATVSPLLSPDFASDLEDFRAAVHRKSLSSKSDFIRVLFDPLLQRLWQPESEVISCDVACDRDAHEDGIAIHSLLLPGKIYGGELCQADLIFQRCPDGWKIVAIHQKFLDWPVENPRWQTVDVRKELRRFAKSVPAR